MRMTKNSERINYSQCWEDPDVLIQALEVTSEDKVLSITSGGDNTLALFAEHPHSIVALDMSASQNYLFELKRASAKALSYDEYLAFLGVHKTGERNALYRKVRPHLGAESSAWWDRYPDFIEMGVIHCGRFERFSLWFKNRILPLIHSKSTVESLLTAESLLEQTHIYRQKWDTWLWRQLFGAAINRFMLRRYARQKEMFDYVEGVGAGAIFRLRLEKLLLGQSVKGNWFLNYSLTGSYGESLPPYLRRSGYDAIREAPDALSIVRTGSILEHLKQTEAKSYSKFNLSDVFEGMSEADNDAVWAEIVRTARDGAVVVYWNNLASRTFPHSLASVVSDQRERAEELQRRDKVFFYGNFHINIIRP